MKEDKTLLFDNVNQLYHRLTELGFPTIIACGSKERMSLFDGTCIPDTDDIDSLPKVIKSFVDSIEDSDRRKKKEGRRQAATTCGVGAIMTSQTDRM